MSLQIISSPKSIGLDIVSLQGPFRSSDAIAYVKRYGYSDKALYAFRVQSGTNMPSVKFCDHVTDTDYEIFVGKLLTDFASIPEIPIIYAQFKLLQPIPPIFHDQAYVLNTDDDNSFGYWTKDGERQKGRMPFSLCNRMYKALLIYYGVSDAKAQCEYLALEIGGHSHYDSHKGVVND